MADIIDLNAYRGRERKTSPHPRVFIQLQLGGSGLLCGACKSRQWHLILPNKAYCANCGRMADNVEFTYPTR